MATFDSCHAKYVRLKFAVMHPKVPPLEIIGQRGNTVSSDDERVLWVADFEMAGRVAIRKHKSRRGPDAPVNEMRRIFAMYFCEFMVMPSDKEAICKHARLRIQEIMRIKEGRFWHLHEMVRRVVGQELEQRELHRSRTGATLNQELREANLL